MVTPEESLSNKRIFGVDGAYDHRDPYQRAVSEMNFNMDHIHLGRAAAVGLGLFAGSYVLYKIAKKLMKPISNKKMDLTAPLMLKK